MAVRSRADLKSIFTTGAKPTRQDFADLFDSYWHQNDSVATQDWTNNNFVQINPATMQAGSFNLASGVLGQPNTVSANTALSLRTDLPGTHGLISEVHNTGPGVAFAGYFKHANGPAAGIANSALALSLSGGAAKLANSLSDYAPIRGGLYFNTMTNKMRLWDTAWTDVATESWSNDNLIQNNAAAIQTASFYINGRGRVYGSMDNYLSVKYQEEGAPFQSAWYHVISPRGSFSGYNDGGNVYLEPTAYTAANSFVNRRRSYEDPLAYYDGVIKSMNPGLRNGHERVGYESIMLAEAIWNQSKAGAFFAAICDIDAPLGLCYLVGSEHVIKNTMPNFSAGAQIMIGMRAVADLNTNGGGINAAGYFKATNAGTTPVHAIYSEAGKNYLKDGVETDQPSANGAGVWKLGKPVTETVTVDGSRYVEVMIDGQLVKLATVILQTVD